MSVENRIFWLLVGILALYLVLTAAGRGGVKRFTYAIFGYGAAGADPGSPPAAPQLPPAQQPKVLDNTMVLPPWFLEKFGLGKPGATN